MALVASDGDRAFHGAEHSRPDVARLLKAATGMNRARWSSFSHLSTDGGR